MNTHFLWQESSRKAHLTLAENFAEQSEFREEEMVSEEIVRLLAAKGEMTLKEIAAAMGNSSSKMGTLDLLQRLRKRGVVCQPRARYWAVATVESLRAKKFGEVNS
jgi:hypothetical protein